MKLN
jgi:hypothetical protein